MSRSHGTQCKCAGSVARAHGSVSVMARGLRVFLGCMAFCLACRRTGGEQQHHERDVGFEELAFEAAKHGMEVIPPEEWMNTRRRLQYAGSNCWDVSVTEPNGICDGLYEGDGDRDVYVSLRGPTLFVATCFEGDCGEHLLAFNRRMFMALAFKCEEGQSTDCPKEEVWGVYSAITNSTTGENRLGFLRAWAEDALHPADVVTQWWTFQYTTLEEAAADSALECVHPDCLIAVNNVTIECESPNWTLPPSFTPLPTMVPIPDGTVGPLPTNAPLSPEELGSFQGSDLNGATSSRGGGGLWQGIGVIAVTAGWWAVVGRMGAVGGG
ncbi:unnamed protein product [Pylaiella littoralis]